MTIALDMGHQDEAVSEGDARLNAIRVVAIVGAIAVVAATAVFGLRAYGAALWPSNVVASGQYAPASPLERLTRDIETLKATNQQLVATQQEMLQTITALRQSHDVLRGTLASRLSAWGTDPAMLRSFEVPRASASQRAATAPAAAPATARPARPTVDPQVRESQRREAEAPALSLLPTD